MKPPSPTSPPTELPHEVALRLKDGLREIRFAARAGARQLAGQMHQAARHAPAWAPPLDEVARLAARAVDGLDKLASGLVAPGQDYRMGHFRLSRLTQAVLAPDAQRALERQCYWSLRHLLQAAGREDVTAHEEAVHQACQRYQSSPQAPDDESGEARRAQRMAVLVRALCDIGPLHLHGSTPHQAQEAAALTQVLATAAVLAPELAALYPRALPQEETGHALQLALCMARSWQPALAHALQSLHPQQALARELVFMLRHC
jgi:hypothetical protein